MTGQRRGYAIALAVAIMVLVASMGAAAALMGTSSNWDWDNAAGSGSSEGWRQGLNGGGMMGQGRGGAGMMGDWNQQDTTRITADAATAAAEAWAEANQPGATVGAGGQMPMGYLFTVTKDGQSVGTLIVNDDTGQVAWWGPAQPSQTPSAS
jgi:hypothetical protein